MGIRENAEPILAKSNKMKVIISCFAISLLVIPLGWTFSSLLATESFAPPAAELVVLDAPDGFEAAVKSMGFNVTNAEKFTDLDIAALTVSAPKGISRQQAAAILAGRYPDLAMDTDTIAMNTVCGARANP